MINQHPITPPPKLIKQWVSESNHNDPLFAQVAVMAACWGADQELAACCEWLDERVVLNGSTALRHARRPKPPTLKEQALALINGNTPYLDDTAMDIIRRALEALPND